MKKNLIIFGLSIFLINFVSAHTGNDYYDRCVVTAGDWIFSISILIICLLALWFLIKKLVRLRKKSK